MTESVPQGVDRLGVALGAVGAGASIGGAIVAAGLCVFRGWQASGHAVPVGIPLLSGPLVLGLMAAVSVAWRLSRPVDVAWYRGVAAGLALFGSAMLVALAAPVDYLADTRGLVIYALVLAGSGALAAMRVRRAARGAT